MLTLGALAALHAEYAGDAQHPVAPMRIGERTFDTDAEPIIMGTVNLSRDSTYRESIAVSAEAAVRKARVMWAHGARLIDIGAESSTARAARVDARQQSLAVEPVVRALTKDGIAVSIETYEPEVARIALDAGATVVNLTGRQHEHAIFDLVAETGASVILCYVAGANVREISDAADHDDPMAILAEHFTERLAVARAHGVRDVAVDPGLGFFYRDLVDPSTRVRYQTRALLRSLRLRTLGLPICQALPHAFDLFEDEFRTAEGFFAVLARMGGAGILRTHEVPRVAAVTRALAQLEV